MAGETKKSSPSTTIPDRICPKDKYYWSDFIVDTENKLFANKKVMISQVTKNLNRVFAILVSDEGCYIRKIDGEKKVFNRCSGITKVLDFQWKYNAKSEDDESEVPTKVKVKLSKFIQEMGHTLNKYNGFVFKPNNIGVSKGELNIWTGFKAKTIDVSEKKVIKHIQPILNHINNVLADGSIENYNYILSWLSHICKTPNIATGKALLFQSDEGGGKTSFLNFFGKQVIGEHMEYVVTSIADMLSDTYVIEGKLFVYAQELGGTSSRKSKYHTDWERMKTLITDKSINIRKLYTNAYQIENYINFIGLSNHEWMASLSATDRRYAAFSCSNKFVGDTKYFKKLFELYEDGVSGDYFFTYLTKYFKDTVDLTKIPDTQLRRTLIANSLPQTTRFIKDYIEKAPKVKKDSKTQQLVSTHMGNDYMKPYQSYLFIQYNEWCKECNEKPCTLKIFNSQLESNLKSITKSRSKKGMYYSLSAYAATLDANEEKKEEISDINDEETETKVGGDDEEQEETIVLEDEKKEDVDYDEEDDD